MKVILKGSGELASVQIEESLMQPGDSEMLADLIVLAHADAKRKLDEQQAALMQQVRLELPDEFQVAIGNSLTGDGSRCEFQSKATLARLRPLVSHQTRSSR